MSFNTGLLGLGLGAAGLASNTYASYQQAKADEYAAEWNAGIMEENAKVKELLAGQALQAGEHEVAALQRSGKQTIETQRAGYAASGVKVDSGSALDVVAEQAGLNQYDQDMAKYNAELAAWGHNMEAANLRQQAEMTKATKRSPAAAAMGSFLSGGTSLYNQYARYKIDGY